MRVYPGGDKISVAPNPCGLKHIEAKLVLPRGEAFFEYRDGKWKITSDDLKIC